MRDIPILMSAPMVRATLAGLKTETRRILKPQPVPFLIGQGCHKTECEVGSILVEGDRRPRITLGRVITCQELRWASGDMLWVRESLRRADGNLWKYTADNCLVSLPVCDPRISQMIAWAHHEERDAVPSIHMPRWASRITLEVTAVRVERLHAIDDAGAIAEGIYYGQYEGWTSGRGQDDTVDFHQSSPVISYSKLWYAINGPGAWSLNPWVAVISFRRIAISTGAANG